MRLSRIVAFNSVELLDTIKGHGFHIKIVGT